MLLIWFPIVLPFALTQISLSLIGLTMQTIGYRLLDFSEGILSDYLKEIFKTKKINEWVLKDPHNRCVTWRSVATITWTLLLYFFNS